MHKSYEIKYLFNLIAFIVYYTFRKNLFILGKQIKQGVNMYFNKDVSMEKKTGERNKIPVGFPIEKINLFTIIPFILLCIGLLALVVPITFVAINGKSQLPWVIGRFMINIILLIWFIYQLRYNKIKFSSVYPKQKRKISFISLIFYITAESVLILFVPIISVINYLESSDVFIRSALNTGNENLFISVVGTVILAPFIEEIIFRLVIQNKIKAKYGAVKAIIFSSILFGLAHLPNSVENSINATIGGFIYAVVYEYTGSIKLSTFLHFFNNLISVILSINVRNVLSGVLSLEIQLKDFRTTLYIYVIICYSYMLFFFINHALKIKKANREILPEKGQ